MLKMPLPDYDLTVTNMDYSTSHIFSLKSDGIYFRLRAASEVRTMRIASPANRI